MTIVWPNTFYTDTVILNNNKQTCQCFKYLCRENLILFLAKWKKWALTCRNGVTIECDMMINDFWKPFFDTRKLLSVSKMFQQPWQEFYKPLNILELQDYSLLNAKSREILTFDSTHPLHPSIGNHPKGQLKGGQKKGPIFSSSLEKLPSNYTLSIRVISILEFQNTLSPNE